MEKIAYNCSRMMIQIHMIHTEEDLSNALQEMAHKKNQTKKTPRRLYRYLQFASHNETKKTCEPPKRHVSSLLMPSSGLLAFTLCFLFLLLRTDRHFRRRRGGTKLNMRIPKARPQMVASRCHFGTENIPLATLYADVFFCAKIKSLYLTLIYLLV